ncbi:MAG: PAS domain S-box protein [Promethearchaeota archaeon]
MKITNNDKKNQFQELVKWSPIPFFGLNDKLVYLFVNIEAAKLVNKSIDELVGNKIIDIFPGIENTVFGKAYLRVLTSRKPETVVDEFVFPEGRKGWYEVKVVPYKKGILCIATDITERKKVEEKLKESEEKYRNLSNELETILDIIPGMVFCKDKSDVITRVNQNFAEALNLKKRDIVGKTTFDLFPKDQATKFREDDLEVINSGNPKLNIEEPANFSDEKIWAITSKVPQFNEKGEIKGIIGLAIDITKRKVIEQKLKESEEKYRNIFEKSSNAIVLLDFTGKIIECNSATETIFGYSKDEFIGQNYLKLPIYSESMIKVLKERFQAIKKELVLKPQELEIKKKDGNIARIKTIISYVKIGEQNFFQAIIQDITEQKNAEEKLKESEEKYRILVENAEEGIWAIDKNANTTFVNQRMAEILGTTKEEMLRKHLFSFMDEESVKLANQYLERRKSGIKERHDFEFLRKDGTKVSTSLGTTPIIDKDGNFLGAFAFVTDITKRKEAEEKIRHSEERFRRLFETMAEGVVLINSDGQIIHANFAAERILGISRSEIEERNYIGPKWEIIRPDGTPMPADEMAGPRAMKEKRLIENIVMGVKRPDDTISWINVSAAPLMDETGSFFGVVGTFSDITEHKMAEEKLKESEKRYKHLAQELEMILDHIPALVFFKDTENNFIRINKYQADAYNLRKEEMQGVSCFDIYPKEQAQAYWDDDLEVIKTEKPKFNIIEPWDTPKGKRWALTSKIPYFDEKGKITGIIGLASDITERINAERKLKESEARYRDAYERAEFYKDLFAHDINNILQNVKSSLGLLSMWRNMPEKSDKINEIMNIMNDQIVRGSKLVSNIRRLSQISELGGLIENVDIFQILKEAIKFISKNFPEKDLNIEIESQIKKSIVRANELLLDVFENILFNAVKYNENPKIEILIRASKDIKEGFNYVKIEFIDNGIGIPDVMKEKIFKGMYSFKDKFNGMGLGLLLVKKLVTNYSGKIWVEDKIQGDPSKGSNFIILIPEVI